MHYCVPLPLIEGQVAGAFYSDSDYSRRYIAGYDTRRAYASRRLERRMAHYRRLSQSPIARVLEIGCGAGEYGAAFRESLSHR